MPGAMAPSASTALHPARTPQLPGLPSERLASAGLVAALGVLYGANSAGLIAYNKFLISEGRFPFAVPLVLCHAVFCSCSCLALYFISPALFPSLTNPAKRVPIDCDLILKGALPIAVLFAGQLSLSNTAYLHSSVAFLQMMKEANLALVYTFSLAAALERFHWRSAGILAAVVVATALTIHGELHFSTTGFALQFASQLFECTKIVLQAMLLSSAGKRLDALSYVLLVMPLCAIALAGWLCVLVFVYPNPHMEAPYWSDIVAWWPHLLANSCVAFGLNVAIALFVKHSSAVAFILAGVAKDAMIVFAGVVMLSEVISWLQALGFLVQLGLIVVYSLAKTFPEKFEHGLLAGLQAVLVGGSAAPGAPAKPGAETRDYGATVESAAETAKMVGPKATAGSSSIAA